MKTWVSILLTAIGLILVLGSMWSAYIFISTNGHIEKSVHAQSSPQWWLIWTDTTHPTELYRPRLYKVQDGGCSVYVLVAGSGGDDGDHLSVSTGAGCK